MQDLQQWLLKLGKDYTIDELENLELLYLGWRQITELPDSLCDLKNLSRLYLDYNRISKIPHTIGKLSNLRVLCLTGNQIREIPLSIRKLKQFSIYMEGISPRSRILAILHMRAFVKSKNIIDTLLPNQELL